MVRFVTALVALATTLGFAHAQSDLVKRGDYLVNGILTCGNCHSPKGPQGDIPGKLFSGGLSWDEPPFKVTAPNITPDKDTGIGKWSAPTSRRLRIGLIPTACTSPGHALRLLRLPDPARPRRRRRLSALAQTCQQQGARPDLQDAIGDAPLPGYRKAPTEAMLKDKVKYGHYLVGIGHCLECHTPMVRGEIGARQIGRGRPRVPRTMGRLGVA